MYKYFKKLTISFLLFLFVVANPLTVLADEVFAPSAGDVLVDAPVDVDPVLENIETPVTDVTGDENASTEEVGSDSQGQDEKSEALEEVDKIKELNDGQEKKLDDSAELGVDGVQALSATTEEGDEYRDDLSGRKNGPHLETDKVSGALVYNYPIEVPPGRNGMQPDLRLTYNSQSNDNGSAFGYGWSVNIPYIERINRYGINRLYTENLFSSSLSGELEDVSLSDGKHGFYGAKVERGAFLKYEYKSDDSWEVTDKNGIKYIFGTNASSRQDDPASSTRIFKWMLQEMRDTNGNFVRYEYYKDAGQIYPDKIKYTSNGNDQGIFEVEFLREARYDNSKQYGFGFVVNSNYRINQIKSEINNFWTSKDSLAYGVGDNGVRSILISITRSGRDGNEVETVLPSTDFNFSKSSQSWTTDGAFYPPYGADFEFVDDGSDIGLRLTDINGDSLPDLVRLDFSERILWLNNGNGWSSVDYGNWSVPEGIILSRGYSQLADVNGDGFIDIVRGDHSGSGVYINDGELGWALDESYYLPNGDDFCFLKDGSNTMDNGFRLVDVNGDGLPDFIRLDFDNVRGLWLNNGHGWTYIDYANWSVPENITMSRGYAQFSDVNSDGLVDIVQGNYFDADAGVYINNGNLSWSSNGSYYLPDGADFEFVDGWGSDTGFNLVDVNNDSLPDLIKLNRDLDRELWINNGYGWTWENFENWDVPENIVLTEGYGQFSDVNGDGLVDIVQGNYYPYGESAVYMNSSSYMSDYIADMKVLNNPKMSIEYKGSAEYVDDEGVIANPNLPYTMQTVHKIVTNDGLGHIGTTTYEYFGGEQYYNSPYDKKFAGYSKIVRTDDVGNVGIDYFHQGNETDNVHGEFADDVSKIGLVYRSEKYDGSNNLFSKAIKKWENYDLGGDRDFVKLTQDLESTYDGNATHRDKATNYVYDNTYGNLTQTTNWGEVTANNDGTFTDLGIDKAVTNISYAQNTPNYIVGLPSQETTTDQNNNKVVEIRHYYDNLALGSVNLGNETKTEQWVSGTNYIDTEKTYNSLGLVTEEKDPRDKTTSYIYDSYNLYPATVTNALNQSNVYEYNYAIGKPKKVTDANGKIFETVFDGVGRVVTEKQPDLNTSGSAVKTSYVYDDISFPRSVRQTSYLDDANGVDSYTYLDGFGRTIQDRKEAEGESNYTVKDTVYNALGQVQKESLPYFATGYAKSTPTTNNNLYTNYIYDAVGRVLTSTNSVGTTANAYDDWKVITTDALNNTKGLYKDAYDNLVKVEENNSGSTYTTEYSYNLLGKLLKIKDALNNERNFTYDGVGRLLSSQDLHVTADTTYGITTYIYDNSGNTTSKIDPANNTVNFTYDDLNRNLTEDNVSTVGTEVAYVYDNCVNGIGKMCSVASASSTSASYTYNNLGLIANESKTIISSTFVSAYTYDRQGNILGLVYPDNTEVRYTYNNAGLLETTEKKEVGESAFVTLVTDIDYSPLGQVVFESYNNNTASNYTYDANKLYRLTSKTTTNASSTKLQDLSYVFDSVGNITKITDNSNTNTKKITDYVYDNLYRLTRASTTNAVSGQNFRDTYTYNAIGNITNKPGQGDYVYNGDLGVNYANPHAVTKTETPMNLANHRIFDGNVNNDAYRDLVMVREDGVYVSTSSGSNFSEAKKWLDDYKSESGWDWSLYRVFLQDVSGDGKIDLVVFGSDGVWVSTSTGAGFNAKIKWSSDYGTGSSWNWSTHRVFVTDMNNDGRADIVGFGDSGVWVSISTGTSFNATSRWIADFGISNGWNWTTNRVEINDANGDNFKDIIGFGSTGTWVSTSTGATFRAKTKWTSNYGTDNWNWSSNREEVIDMNNDGRADIVGFGASGVWVSTSTGSSFNAMVRWTTDYAVNSGWNWAVNREKVVDVNDDGKADIVGFGNSGVWVSLSSGSVFGATSKWIDDYSVNNGWDWSHDVFHVFDINSGGSDIVAHASNGTYVSLSSGSAFSPKSKWISPNGVSYVYDPNGNLTNDGTWTHTWDYNNRLIQSTRGTSTSIYTYDHTGSRISKTENNSTTIYASKYYDIENGKIAKHVYAGGTEIATIESNSGDCIPPTSGTWTISTNCTLVASVKAPGDVVINPNAVLTINVDVILEINLHTNKLLVKKNGGVLIKKGGTIRQTTSQTFPTAASTINYLHTDHLGGGNVVTNKNGNIAQVLDYFPFGDIRINQQISGFDEKNKFTGHERDDSTGLNYMVARYYDGNVGRFISQDPMIQSIGGDLSEYEKSLDELLANPQSLNSYSYTINNPLKYIDPTGETYTEATGGYFVGIGQSLWGTAKGLASSIAHPINTVKGIGTSISNAGNEWKQFASDVTSDPKGTMSQIGEGTQISYNEFMDMSDYEKGKAIGRTTEKVMEAVTVKKVSEGLAGGNLRQTTLGADKGVQFGKYNVGVDKYNRGGGGINLRDTSLSQSRPQQRIFGVDYHSFKFNGEAKSRLHYHSGTGSAGAKHRPYQK